MAKRIQLTKRGEKQYEYLQKKGIKLTRREFKDYYDNLRKANKKLTSKAFRKTALKANPYTLSVSRIRSREDFLKARRNVNTVLRRDYKKRLNEAMRNQLYKNIRKELGARNAKEIIDKLKDMTDDELLEFFRANDDLESILYDSDNPIMQYIDMTVEKFNNRIEAYEALGSGLVEEREANAELVLDEAYKEQYFRRRGRRKRSRKRKV